MCRLSPNPSRVDRLVQDMCKEHFKVLGLVAKIDNLKANTTTTFLASVHTTLRRWLDAIHDVFVKRQNELINRRNGENGMHQINERGMFFLSNQLLIIYSLVSCYCFLLLYKTFLYWANRCIYLPLWRVWHVPQCGHAGSYRALIPNSSKISWRVSLMRTNKCEYIRFAVCFTNVFETFIFYHIFCITHSRINIEYS